MKIHISPLLLLITLTRYIFAFVDIPFTNGLIKLLDEGVTDDQIRKWWFRSQATQRNFSRTFPFCFAPDRNFPPEVAPYESHFTKLSKIYYYDPDDFGWPSREKMNKFKSMDFKRISIRRRKPIKNVFGGEEGKDPLKLQQWVDFLVTFTEPIEGLYVQAYGGPMGVPTGEFTTDFKCTDGEVDDRDYEQNQNIVPCHFSPRTAFMHPNVFIFDARGRGKKDKVQFRFRWTETQCQETGYFQFIMIATTDHSTQFDSILSPIFNYVTLDSPSAVPTPYHPFYDIVTCGLGSGDSYTNNIRMIDSGLRIIPNRLYDDCIVNQTSRGNRNQFTGDSCPPGPFMCKNDGKDRIWTSAAGWKIVTKDWWGILVNDPLKKCCEVEFPLKGGPPPIPTTTTKTTTPTTTTPEPTLQQKQEKFLKDVTITSEKKLGITHGDYCILVWLVLMPIANLISRFFKDFPDLEGIGLGVWIISHVLLQTVGVMIVWWSFGLVVGGGEDKLGNISGRHFLLGTVSTTIQHLQFLTGLRRQEKERKAFNYVLMHAYGGYLAQLIAYLAIILSNAQPERKWMVFGFTLIGVICAIAFYLVERKQDKILGVVLHRAQCPVLQRIVLDDRAKPPLGYVKIAILIFLVASKTALYVFMKIAYSPDIVVSRQYRDVSDVDDLLNETAADARTVVMNKQAYFVDFE